MTSYEKALAALEPAKRSTVEHVLADWSATIIYCRISQNIANETALTIDHFTSLLTTFADHLLSGKSPTNAWQTSCRSHQRRGRSIPDIQCPEILGRVKKLEQHAKDIEKVSRGDLTENQAKKLLLKHAGSSNPIGFEDFLRDAPLGNFLIWATFNPVNSRVDPFVQLPRTHRGICTALGLGHFTSSDILIILTWNHADCDSPDLHRPTVADAEDSQYYKPRPETDALWGLTEPLSPNPGRLQPQPEVVMPKTTSQGLRLPFHIIQSSV